MRNQTHVEIDLYIDNVFMVISPETATRDSHYLLALVTLGSATEIGSFLFVSRRPRWPRQVWLVYISGISQANSH
jgi:hypothetical protein